MPPASIAQPFATFINIGGSTIRLCLFVLGSKILSHFAVAPHNFITFLLVCSQKRLLLFVVVFVDVAVVVAVVVSSSRTLGHFD